MPVGTLQQPWTGGCGSRSQTAEERMRDQMSLQNSQGSQRLLPTGGGNTFGARNAGVTLNQDAKWRDAQLKKSREMVRLTQKKGKAGRFERLEETLKAARGSGLGQRLRSQGYVPGFALSTAVGQAVAREKTRMPSGSQAKVGFDPRVGVGVYNSSEGSLSNAINMHMALGRSASEIQHAGSASYVAKPTVPSFNLDALNTIITQLTDTVGGLSSFAKGQMGSGQGGGGGTAILPDNSELVSLLGEVVSGIGGLSATFNEGMIAQAEAITNSEKSIKLDGAVSINANVSGSVQDASAAIVEALTSKVNAIMKNTLTPAEQGEINMLSNFNNSA